MLKGDRMKVHDLTTKSVKRVYRYKCITPDCMIVGKKVLLDREPIEVRCHLCGKVMKRIVQ